MPRTISILSLHVAIIFPHHKTAFSRDFFFVVQRHTKRPWEGWSGPGFSVAAAAIACFKSHFFTMFISANRRFGFHTDSLIYTIVRLWSEGGLHFTLRFTSLFGGLLPPAAPLPCLAFFTLPNPRYHDKNVLFMFRCSVVFLRVSSLYFPNCSLGGEKISGFVSVSSPVCG